MSILSYLVCRSRQLTIALGKPLMRSDGTISDFGHGYLQGAERAQLDRALWKFLAATAGESLVVAGSDHPDFDTIAGWPMIGGEVEDGNIPLNEYLGEEVAIESDDDVAFTYFGSVGGEHGRTSPVELFRRRMSEGHSFDEIHVDRREWEPTTVLRMRRSGWGELDLVEITEAEAEAVVRRRADPPTVGDPIA